MWLCSESTLGFLYVALGLSVCWQQSRKPHKALSMRPACSLQAQGTATEVRGDQAALILLTAGLPSARTVKGESPGRLAENWPPREVIRKHRLKKPIPTTKILQEERQRQSGQLRDKRATHKVRAHDSEKEKEHK